MFKDYTLQTTWGRALFAFIGGTAVGAAFIAGYIALALLPTLALEYSSLTAAFIDISGAVAIFFALAFAYWGGGIMIFGCPVWFVLHKLGLRTWIAALTSGFLVSSIIGFLMAPAFLNRTQNVSWATLGNPAIFGLIGTLVALTIWRIAYRRPSDHV